MIAVPPSARPHLQIVTAVKEGWAAFCRAPWVFVGFSALLILLQAFCQKLQEQAGSPPEMSSDPLALSLALIGSLAGLVVNLWGITGFVRGAWCALEGRHPRFTTLIRWDGAANLRLFMPQLLLGLVLVAAASLLGVSGILMYQLHPWLAVPPGLVLLALVIYLLVNQNFLAQVALLEGHGPVSTLQRGRRVVDPAWSQVLLLALLEAVLVLAGIAAFLVGFLVAWPVLVCISTAAYRQLFGSTDQAGLLNAADRTAVLSPATPAS